MWDESNAPESAPATLLGLGERKHWKDPDGGGKGRRAVLAQVIAGEDPLVWAAVDGDFHSVEGAMAFVERAMKRPHFVLGVLRDRQNGRVTKITPKTAAEAAISAAVGKILGAPVILPGSEAAA